MRVLSFRSSAERIGLPDVPHSISFDFNRMEEDSVDLHQCVIGDDDAALARCSLWWSEVPLFGDQAVGIIGHYASADEEAAMVLLEAAEQHLKDQACTLVIGPMDGNIWRSYRFVTDAGSEPPFLPEPPFLMEPSNPPEWPLQFERAGFSTLSEYFSGLNVDLASPDERIAPFAAKMTDRGIAIRTAEQANLHRELGRIYELSRVAFTRNFLYTPITEDSFRRMYAKILPYVRPELVLLAERDSQLVGYLFAIPDLAQAARGKPVNTFIIKTVAILPDAEFRGLGSLLVHRAHQAGAQLGFSRCIHALMHESNTSRNISNHYASTMRRYTLYGKEIAP